MSENALPDGWAVSTVADLCRVVGGGTPSTKEERYWNGDVPWITSADILDVSDVRPRRAVSREAIEHSATNLVPAGSVIVVTRVGLGKVALAPTPLCFSQDSQALVFDHAVLDPMYLAYYLKQAVQVFRHIGRGTTISGVTTKQLRELGIRLPPLGEQLRIVQKIEELFTKLDAAVAALERVRANLKRYRAAVLKAAVGGKLTEDWRAEHPGVEPASDLLERILEERQRKRGERELARYTRVGKTLPKNWQSEYQEPAEPDTGELPELPEGWCWANLGAVAEVRLGKMLSPKAYAQGLIQLPYLRNENVRWGWIDFSDVKTMGFKEDEVERYSVEPGDLMVCEGGEAGRCAVFLVTSERYMYQKALHRVRTVRGVIHTHFLQHCLEHFVASGVAIPRASETTIQHLTLEKMQGLPVPLCSIEEQDAVVSEVERRLSIAGKIEHSVTAQLRRATGLRQSILRCAFEGRLAPQDPADEPASVLLERIRATGRSSDREDDGRHSARKLRAGAHQPSLFDEAQLAREAAT